VVVCLPMVGLGSGITPNGIMSLLAGIFDGHDFGIPVASQDREGASPVRSQAELRRFRLPATC
jgi:hypothetical protein